MTAIMEPVVERAGAELVDLEFAGSASRPILRAYVDTAEGITLDACARLSRQIEEALESSGAVPARYVLEVSSPGIERPLTKREHFERYRGAEAAVRLYAKVDGRKRFTGVIEDVADGPDGTYTVTIAGDDGRWTFDSQAIARAKLQVRWD